jgi:coenzyme F420-dependent glucose-6-phosphate dehydrogenase
VIAQAFGTLAAMFPDRVILGLGSGESLNDVPAVGIKWPGFKERQSRLREAIVLMRRLWSEDRVTFEGEYYKTSKATIYDRPAKPLPVYVAASGPTVARMAGELADGYICTSGKSKELYTETLLPNLAAGLASAGRTTGSVDRMIEMKVSFDTDRDRALADTKNWAELALSPEEKMSQEDPIELERLAAALPTERTAKRWIVSIDADEHVEKIKFYLDLGFRHLVFHAPGHDQHRFLDLYSERVLPKLRGL